MSTPSAPRPVSPAAEYLSLPQVALLLSLSKRTIYLKLAAQDFPAPRVFGPRLLRWRRSEVVAWAERQTWGTQGRPPRARGSKGTWLRTAAPRCPDGGAPGTGASEGQGA